MKGNDAHFAQSQSLRTERAAFRFAGDRSVGFEASFPTIIECLDEVARIASNRCPLSTRQAAPGQDIACISAEIFIVAKLEKVSDTAYGKMI
jgi:hypothetical protein